jgi:hypothetical protein
MEQFDQLEQRIEKIEKTLDTIANNHLAHLERYQIAIIISNVFILIILTVISLIIYAN